MIAASSHIIDIIRHGETTAGSNCLIGCSDVPLSARGWQQLQQVVAHLTLGQPLSVYTSPLRRCADFADDFACRHGVTAGIEDDFREMDFGDWEMTSMDRLRDDQTFRCFFQAPHRHTPPGGESFAVFRQRVERAWRKLTDAHRQGHAVLFTHGGVMRVLCCLLLQLPMHATSRVFIPHAGQLRVCINDDGVTLLSLNGYPCGS